MDGLHTQHVRNTPFQYAATLHVFRSKFPFLSRHNGVHLRWLGFRHKDQLLRMSDLVAVIMDGDAMMSTAVIQMSSGVSQIAALLVVMMICNNWYKRRPQMYLCFAEIFLSWRLTFSCFGTQVTAVDNIP